MIPYMSLEEQVDSDFIRARRRALLRRVIARFHKDPTHNRLLSFDEVREASLADNRTYLGTKIVEAEKIVGSVGRQSDFDRSFLPARTSVEARWKRVDRAFHRIKDLPPVSLYKIGDAYFVLDGHHRVSVARYHGVKWIDADVTEFRALSGTPSPVEPTRPRTIEEKKEQIMPNEPSEVEDPKMHEMVDPRARIEVRWGLHEDEAQIAELMELNGMRRVLAFEERFIVAERDGEILAAMQYRTEPKWLLLGLLVSDPWAEERPLAVALYARAGELARQMGVGEVRARPVLHADDYPYEAGYRWRYPGGWYLDTRRPLRSREELPAGGWRRMVALLGVPAVPFFSAFRGAGRRMDGSK